MRYFLELSYLGSAYNGWQRQLNAPSVQQTLEESLSVILRAKTEITGAGRTDTGVHASYYVAHLDTPGQLPTDFCYHLNSLLPGDIAVSRAVLVRDDLHARFDAVRREYRYRIVTHKDPFQRETAWQYYGQLDIEAMNRAASMLPGHADFATFSKLHSNNKTTTCEVYKSLWESVNGEFIYTIAANRFLRNMVRSLVGTLVDVGRGKITEEEFRAILRSGDRSQASGSAPAQGLFLTDIVYDADDFIKHCK